MSIRNCDFASVEVVDHFYHRRVLIILALFWVVGFEPMTSVAKHFGLVTCQTTALMIKDRVCTVTVCETAVFDLIKGSVNSSSLVPI